MNTKSLVILAIIVTGMLSISSTGLLQSASADKDCSVGKAIQEQGPGKEWGDAVSEFAKQEGGLGQEVFKTFNEGCHSD